MVEQLTRSQSGDEAQTDRHAPLQHYYVTNHTSAQCY